MTGPDHRLSPISDLASAHVERLAMIALDHRSSPVSDLAGGRS
jgi:hypothetical protein